MREVSIGPYVGMTPERPSVVETIESCTLLNALTPEQKEFLAASCFMAFAERGETIWLSGTPSDFSAVCAAGFVKMTRSSPHGQEVAVELLGPGQAFGLLAAIEGRPFPLSALAVTNCWYLKIPTRVLLPIYRQSGPLKDQIVRSLGPRLRRAHSMMSRLSSGRVPERIAAVLLILVDSYGVRTPHGFRIQVPLTRQDIGDMAGTTVESTIRVMSRWQKEGLVATSNQVITVRDPEALSNLLQSP